jgi:hypothetical protein
MTLEPILTPHGVLALREIGEALALEPQQGLRLEKAFARGAGHGLLWLGANEVGTALPPVLSYWRDLGVRYVTALCALPGIGEGEVKPPVPIPTDGELDRIAAAVPPMTGSEYLTVAVLGDLWRGVDTAFDTELAQAGLSLPEFRSKALRGRKTPPEAKSPAVKISNSPGATRTKSEPKWAALARARKRRAQRQLQHSA